MLQRVTDRSGHTDTMQMRVDDGTTMNLVQFSDDQLGSDA